MCRLYLVVAVTLGAMVSVAGCVGDTPTQGPDASGADSSVDVGATDGPPVDTGASPDAAPDAASDGGTDSAPPCYPSPTGIFAWWTGDNVFTDKVGNHTLTNAILVDGGGVKFTSAGEVGIAFDVDSTAYLLWSDVPNPVSYSALSVEGWVAPTVNAGSVVAGNIQGTLAWRIDYPDSLTLRFRLVSDMITVSPPAAGTFFHVAGTWDGTTMKLYVNGAPSGTPVTHTVPVTVDTLRLGASSGGPMFTGRLDEFAVYNRALSATEVAAIAAAGSSGRCKN